MTLSITCCTVMLALAAQAVAAEQYESVSPAPGTADTPAAPEASTDGTASPRKVDVSLPYTPYPAGLSWVLTPQSFRVPIPDRIYYPPAHYVRRCPYYPRGYYWGANWRFNVIGRGNLLFMGTFRYNPYLTAAKASHDPKLRGQRRYAPPAGPVGQAMLLGSSGPQGLPLPPTLADDAQPEAGRKIEAQVATVRRAPEKRPAHKATSRRTKRLGPGQLGTGQQTADNSR